MALQVPAEPFVRSFRERPYRTSPFISNSNTLLWTALYWEGTSSLFPLLLGPLGGSYLDPFRLLCPLGLPGAGAFGLNHSHELVSKSREGGTLVWFGPEVACHVLGWTPS